MDLKDFIAATLTQIVRGVSESAAAISEMGGAVSPAYKAQVADERIGLTLDGKEHPVYSISFDVAVVASESGATEGGARLQVAGIGFGAKATSADKQETTSRVQFIVPLQLPVDPKSAQAAEEEQKAAVARGAEADRKLAAAAQAHKHW
jgi:hypothetical protein